MKNERNNDFQRHVPEIIFDAEPRLPEFVRFAWKCAADHIRECPGAPQARYMDEAFAPDRIWIWDTCFMALYCKYAQEYFPGIESLRNFYEPMLDGRPTPLKIHIPDNPPLFAWAEWESWKTTGNSRHLEEIFFHHRYPQRMFRLFESFKAGQRFDYMTSPHPVTLEKTPLGYHWSGGRCGMDNTPRGNFGPEILDNNPAYRKILFLDAAAQQALAARLIFEITGEREFQDEYETLADLLNRRYWDEQDGCYYDLEAESPHRLVKVMTPASYWPLLAGTASPEQAEKLAAHVENPEEFGGAIPLPSVARNSPHFNPGGAYWRGGVWLPTAYMTIKALEKNHFTELADRTAENLLRHLFQTWESFRIHTIWEAYSPTKPEPSQRKQPRPGEYVRPDFCGWSALGPINLMIENVLGFRTDAPGRTLEWRIHQTFRHGIRNLRFGPVTCSLETDGQRQIRITSDSFFFLKLGKETIRIPAGETTLPFSVSSPLPAL